MFQLGSKAIHSFSTWFTVPFSGSTPTHSTKSKWVDSKKSSSFAAESEAYIEYGKNKEDDAGSIHDGGDLEMKLNIIDENAEGQRDNDLDKPIAVSNTSFGPSASAAGALDEDEKCENEQAEPKDMDPCGPTSATTTFGVQNGNNTANDNGGSEGN